MYFHARGKSHLALGYSSYFVEVICSQEGCWSVVSLSRDAWLWHQGGVASWRELGRALSASALLFLDQELHIYRLGPAPLPFFLVGFLAGFSPLGEKRGVYPLSSCVPPASQVLWCSLLRLRAVSPVGFCFQETSSCPVPRSTSMLLRVPGWFTVFLRPHDLLKYRFLNLRSASCFW